MIAEFLAIIFLYWLVVISLFLSDFIQETICHVSLNAIVKACIILSSVIIGVLVN